MDSSESKPKSGLFSKPDRTWSDEDLVEACLEGNQQAWAALIAKYKNLVYSAPVKYRMSDADAADIFQEVWVDLHAELRNLRAPGALRGWLFSVAAHKCYQWKRRRARESGGADTAAREPVSRELLFPEWKERAERAQLLRDTIAALPERCRRMLEMLFFHDPPLPYAEVARRLGLAEGSIGFIRARCLRRLREDLERGGF